MQQLIGCWTHEIIISFYGENDDRLLTLIRKPGDITIYG